MFARQVYFSAVMSRDSFTTIRASLKVYAEYDHNMATVDILWHLTSLLKHIRVNCVRMAVVMGVMSSVERALRCKAQTSAKTYIKNKPIEFGNSFYVLICCSSRYIFSLMDTGSVIKTIIPTATSYAPAFWELRTVLSNLINRSLTPTKKPSACWTLQMTYPTRTKASSEGLLVVTDNFYTRHALAASVKQIKYGEVLPLGTVHMNTLDLLNKETVTRAKVQLTTRSEETGACAKSWNSHSYHKEELQCQFRSLFKTQDSLFGRTEVVCYFIVTIWTVHLLLRS